MIKIEINSPSKSPALYDALWKSIQKTLDDFRHDYDGILKDTTTTGSFNPNK